MLKYLSNFHFGPHSLKMSSEWKSGERSTQELRHNNMGLKTIITVIQRYGSALNRGETAEQ